MRWKCGLCEAEGNDSYNGFHKHYIRNHYEGLKPNAKETNDAAADNKSGQGTGAKPM